MDLGALHRFVVAAKRATYISGAGKAESSRHGSRDLAFAQGPWHYADSYFGGTDFLGQEVVWFEDRPVWVMNYHGYILRPDLIDGARAAETLRAALGRDTTQARLLDNFDWHGPHGHFSIASEGSIARFKGRETIHVDGILAYALDYQGGLVFD